MSKPTTSASRSALGERKAPGRASCPELDRAEKIAAAIRSLKELNDQAQFIFAGTLQRLGVWDYGLQVPGPSKTADIAPRRFGAEAIHQAVSGVN